MEETNKKYTAKDFALYHSGNMLSHEMHALEKAALEDPFLADALEGYLNTTNFESDIVELKARLEEKRKKGKVFSITSFAQNKWWRIAALFVIIAGAGYFFFKTNNISKENSLAKNEIKTIQKKNKSAAPSTNDSATTNDVAFEKPKPFQFSRDQATLPKPNNRIEKENYEPKLKAPSKTMAPSVSREKNISAADNISAMEEKQGIQKPEKEYVIKGKIMDEKGNPIALASITDPIENKVILTDTAGKFLLTLQDTSTTVIASAAGYASKNVTIKKDEQPTIEMNKNDTNLQEVAVASIKQKEEKKQVLSRAKALNGKVAGVEISKPGIEPFAKNEKFEQYLKENMVTLYDQDNERQTGEVLLSFVIDKNGRPEKIEVLKSSCKICKKEAIRLLENGPAWNMESNKRGTVIIKF